MQSRPVVWGVCKAGPLFEFSVNFQKLPLPSKVYRKAEQDSPDGVHPSSFESSFVSVPPTVSSHISGPGAFNGPGVRGPQYFNVYCELEQDAPCEVHPSSFEFSFSEISSL